MLEREVSVQGVVPQGVFELTGVAIGLWAAALGVIAIFRPAKVLGRADLPMRPRVARTIGVSAVLLGLAIGIGSFFLYSEPRCRACASRLWSGSNFLARLIGLLGLLGVLVGILWARRRPRS